MLSLELLQELRAMIQQRRIGDGIALLEEHRDDMAEAAPGKCFSGLAISCLAQWMDVGFDDHGILATLLERFPPGTRHQLQLAEYIHLRAAEGFLAMRRENLTDALRHFETALTIGEEANDGAVGAIASFWRARCLRKAGEYDQALEEAKRGFEIACSRSMTYFAAVIRTLESWLLFQKGEPKQSIAILQEAEAALRDTDDFITLGNIQSTYGRIAMREGRYDHAMQYFDSSIDLFERRSSLQGYLARSRTNIAQAKRFSAMQLRRSIEAKWEHRKDKPLFDQDRKDKAGQLERMHELLRNAQADLAQADAIYKRLQNHHGAGNVAVNLAQIQLDLGNLEEADRRAGEAFNLGATKADYVLMCRARIVQATVANARFEEEIGDSEDPSRFAQAAHDSAKEAVDLGERTESRRLLAQAHICYGLTLVNGFFMNTEAARACCARAEAYLGHDRNDALWQEIEALRTKISRAGIEDPNLRAWSQGAVGDKSLQEVVGQFEELLIRKVWEHEGRKVSRVAQRLAVSPKKVRRVLRHLGLLLEPASENGDL